MVDGEPQGQGQLERAPVGVQLAALTQPHIIRVRAVPFGFAAVPNDAQPGTGWLDAQQDAEFLFPNVRLAGQDFLSLLVERVVWIICFVYSHLFRV